MYHIYICTHFYIVQWYIFYVLNNFSHYDLSSLMHPSLTGLSPCPAITQVKCTLIWVETWNFPIFYVEKANIVLRRIILNPDNGHETFPGLWWHERRIRKENLFFFSVTIHILEKTGQEIFPNRKLKSLKKVLSFYYIFIVKFNKISLCK